MELLKSNPIIDERYKPSVENGYIEYFNRAMVFAQTNYQDQLDKFAKMQFRKLSPTIFFDEYVWSVCCIGEQPKDVSGIFSLFSKELTPFYHSFWDLNSFPREKFISENISPYEIKYDAIYRCASIVNRGIKLFGWDHYKDNFLDTPEKLSALPHIGIAGANQLTRNIGLEAEVISHSRLYDLAMRWEFDDTISLCKAIQKFIPMQLKVIELILWYTVTTFENNIPAT